ncbi:hypothetical protein V6N13_050391 [Hibiscus sabdariffa]
MDSAPQNGLAQKWSSPGSQQSLKSSLTKSRATPGQLLALLGCPSTWAHTIRTIRVLRPSQQQQRLLSTRTTTARWWRHGSEHQELQHNNEKVSHDHSCPHQIPNTKRQ